jgi:ABC-type sugar transport system permease subunit
MEGKSFWNSLGVVVILLITIGLFGTGYGLVINLLSRDTYEKIKGQLNTIFIVDAVLIFVLMIISLMLIKSDPTMFQPYILVTTHLALLISLLSVSYSVLRISY